MPPVISLIQPLRGRTPGAISSVASNWLILINELSLLPFKHDQPFISDSTKFVAL